jgi:hypothetical protein
MRSDPAFQLGMFTFSVTAAESRGDPLPEACPRIRTRCLHDCISACRSQGRQCLRQHVCPPVLIRTYDRIPRQVNSHEISQLCRKLLHLRLQRHCGGTAHYEAPPDRQSAVPAGTTQRIGWPVMRAIMS